MGQGTWLEKGGHGEEIEQLEEQEEEQGEGDFLSSPEFADSAAWISKEPP